MLSDRSGYGDLVIGQRLDSWIRGHELFVDAVTALLLTAGCVLIGLLVRADAGYFLFSLLLVTPLVLRRRRPVLCGAVVVSVAFAQWLTVADTTGALPADLAVPMAVHAAAAYGPRWAAWSGLAAGLFGAVLGGVSWPQLPVPFSQHALIAAFLGSAVLAAWALGALHRLRRRQVDTLAERARLLEADRDQRARIAVLAERARIAREVHDVVAHSLAVVIAQADGGRYAAAAEPGAGLSALVTIGDCARQALGETRRVLGLLRDDPGEQAAPQPGIEDIPALVDRVREGGLDIRLTVQAPPSPVERGLGLVAYRIVQEGLTNVIKHVGPTARVEVSVRWDSHGLEIDVLDEGPSATDAPATGGYGVIGMRERASAYGGTVTLRPRPGGGRALNARIPVMA
ncbi:two component system sensor kinase [Kutzneria albida DSM 43870]|uniref:histidine kinase n=1 Tax=Kutzneria albida DSM 43870 TaxID=1449976 RepID=W5W7Z6_9PSEU|nr:two component system sensor kinase [Kutzneria albida DSM 43870]